MSPSRHRLFAALTAVGKLIDAVELIGTVP